MKLVYNPRAMLRDFKIFFYVIHMLISCSGSERRLASLSPWVSLCGGTMGVGRRWKGTTAAGGASMSWCSDGWSFNVMVLWVSGGENGQGWDDLFIAVEGESRAVRGGWPMAVVRIQCSGFDLKGEAMGWNIGGRWSGGIELVLAPWEGSVTWRDRMTTSIGGEAPPRLEERRHWAWEREETTPVGLTRSWSGDELWRQNVLGLVGLKRCTWSLILVLPHNRREMLDSMVRWYPRKTLYVTWNRCSRRMGISMKMLVIELKLTG
jgi:hypothetical protein